MATFGSIQVTTSLQWRPKKASRTRFRQNIYFAFEAGGEAIIEVRVQFDMPLSSFDTDNMVVVGGLAYNVIRASADSFLVQVQPEAGTRFLFIALNESSILGECGNGVVANSLKIKLREGEQQIKTQL